MGAAPPSRSCRSTPPLRVKYAVGPNGRWQTTIPSGSPLVSWKTMRSVKSEVLQTSTSSSTLWVPLLILVELGTISFISLANCLSRLDGLRDVVTQTLGSLHPASPYSSSMWLVLPACLASSWSISPLSLSYPARSSVGRDLPWDSASRTFRLASYVDDSAVERDFRKRYSRRSRACRLWEADDAEVEGIVLRTSASYRQDSFQDLRRKSGLSEDHPASSCLPS